MVINDVIVFFPMALVSAVSDYAHASSIDWLVKLRQLEALEKDHEILTSALAERLALIEEMHAEQELLRRALAEQSAMIEGLNRLRQT
jgi:hypothetical protein